MRYENPIICGSARLNAGSSKSASKFIQTARRFMPSFLILIFLAGIIARVLPGYSPFGRLYFLHQITAPRSSPSSGEPKRLISL